MKKRFTEEQIIGILKENEAGVKLVELVRRYGVCEQTIYRWKNKYGGMNVSEAKRLKALEVENSQLKRLVAEKELDILGLKAALSKKY